MNRLLCITAAALGLMGLAAAPGPTTEAPRHATSANQDKVVFVIPIEGVINPSLTYVVRRGIRQAANDDRVKAIVFDMHTDGGRLDVTEQIIRLIQNLDVPTYTFVNSRAFSAGAIISLATDHIYMAPNSVIGDAMPIMVSPMGGPQEMPEALEEKMVSAVAALIRGAAQHKGHDPLLAEAMVRRELEYAIDGEIICPAGELLTLTNVEAGRLFDGTPLLSRGTVEDIETLIALEGLADSQIVQLTILPSEQFARWIEALSFIFLAGGLLGLYIEIRSPGFGLPGITGLLLLAVWFWGHHIAGLSGIMELALFMVGFGLLLAEVFVVPGFGLTGILGIAMMMGAIMLSMIEFAPAGPILPRQIDFMQPLQTLMYTVLLTGLGVYLVTIFLPGIPVFRRLILSRSTDRAHGYQASDDTTELLGNQGTTLTSLRPAGAGLFGDRRLDVVSRGDFIEAGIPIVIVETHGNRIIVERKTDHGLNKADSGQ